MLAETLGRRDDLQRRRTALVPYSQVARAVVRLVVGEINLHARAETLLRAGLDARFGAPSPRCGRCCCIRCVTLRMEDISTLTVAAGYPETEAACMAILSGA